MNYNNIDYMEKNAPATKEDIQYVKKQINETIPKLYKEVLSYSNGISMSLCVLYDTSTIIESYECNEFSINMPGYISIGNDNGDRELIMKAEKETTKCGFLDATEIGNSEVEEWFDFKSWVENGCKIEDDEEDSEYGKVYIVKVPDDKLKFLAETKKLFALPFSTGVLYKKINHLPCAIVDDMKEALADTIIKKTSHPDCFEYRNK
ncbi:SMI1/KNR4 family protein [uncultured Catenibacterium sp.]|uniref:SMI1/KNR4 family protein n=1 Tax=uncultured Catenibacterium sp. TaxID=286142 RepID=UPI0025F3ADAD|nr:SMI1/KNR4 family protein [uncultured Catenibacterium sp.]